ncbi:hypothetical protein SAMD00019534_068010, partial [Acytostelium subglobosum LB1]|uniref:hypothetical protein n=1 Tax=Acytostelium subglobosum LB1 TaxID=1410327 RepID=UPI000644E8FD
MIDILYLPALTLTTRSKFDSNIYPVHCWCMTIPQTLMAMLTEPFIQLIYGY